MMKKMMVVLMLVVGLLVGSTSVFAGTPRTLINLPKIEAPKIVPISVDFFKKNPDLTVEENKVLYDEYMDNTKVVEIEVYQKINGEMNYVQSGAGFMLPNGYIATVNHVASESIEGNKDLEFRVTFYNQRVHYSWAKATLVATDMAIDATILKVDVERIPLDYRNSYVDAFDTSYDFDEKIKIIGHPSYGEDLPISVTDQPESVSSYFVMLSHTWETGYGTVINGNGLVDRARYVEGKDIVMSTVKLNVQSYKGNSGGPVFNEQKELVGMITGASVREKSVSFAIKSTDIMGLIEANGLKEVIFNQ